MSLGAVVLALLGAGCYVLFGLDNAHTISGTIAVYHTVGEDTLDPGDVCVRAPAYSALATSGVVRVSDDRDQQVGDGDLSEGTYDGESCVFHFRVAVPTARSYVITVGGSYASEMHRSSEQLDAANWSVSLDLGN